MAEKKSVMLYLDAIKQWEMLTDEQAGILIKAILNYSISGERLNTTDGMLAMAFSFFSAQIDRDSEKWITPKMFVSAGKRKIRTYTTVHE